MKLMSETQTAGPLIVLGAFAASDISVRLLDAYPSAAFAWYLNIEVFHAFGVARAEASPLALLLGSYALELNLLLIAAVVLFRLAQFKLGVAFLANLSFGIAFALTYCCCHASSFVRTAFLAESGTGCVYDPTLVAILLAASFAAFVTSHMSFVREIRSSR